MSHERRQIQELRLRALDLIRADFNDRTWETSWRYTVEGTPRLMWPGTRESVLLPLTCENASVAAVREKLGDLQP